MYDQVVFVCLVMYLDTERYGRVACAVRTRPTLSGGACLLVAANVCCCGLNHKEACKTVCVCRPPCIQYLVSVCGLICVHVAARHETQFQNVALHVLQFTVLQWAKALGRCFISDSFRDPCCCW